MASVFTKSVRIWVSPFDVEDARDPAFPSVLESRPSWPLSRSGRLLSQGFRVLRAELDTTSLK